MEKTVSEINSQIANQLADPATLNLLVSKVFTGFTPELLKQAVAEGVMRGFEFKDFLEKNVYAIKYGNTYSLVTSIDYARKKGMRSGIVGKSAPSYEEKDGKIISCTVTVKRKVSEYIGDFTATVYWDEYYAGHKKPDGTIKTNQYGEMKPNLWDTKPHTMIAKVAELHALRMACPEEMAQVYVEEEYQKGEEVDEKSQEWIDEIASIQTIDELREYYKANSGRGKEFDKLVNARKKQLLENNANS